MDEEEEAKLLEREAAILKARENISEETLKEYKDIFSFFDRLNVYGIEIDTSNCMLLSLSLGMEAAPSPLLSWAR